MKALLKPRFWSKLETVAVLTPLARSSTAGAMRSETVVVDTLASYGKRRFRADVVAELRGQRGPSGARQRPGPFRPVALEPEIAAYTRSKPHTWRTCDADGPCQELGRGSRRGPARGQGCRRI